MRKLPENWCVKNDGSLLFRNTVIRYLYENKYNDLIKYDLHIQNTYFGAMGSKPFFNAMLSPNNPPSISLKEFIEITGAEEDLALLVVNELLYEQGRFTGRQLKTELYEKFGLSISTMHVREILHGLRCSGKLPLLVANTTGYWIATTTMEVEKYRDFLQERAKKFFELSACIRDQAELKFGNQLDLQMK